jgi:hypothetical protein
MTKPDGFSDFGKYHIGELLILDRGEAKVMYKARTGRDMHFVRVTVRPCAARRVAQPPNRYRFTHPQDSGIGRPHAW